MNTLASPNTRSQRKRNSAATDVIAKTQSQNMVVPQPLINLLGLRSPDVDRASKFYIELGLFFTKHRHGTGPEHYSSCVNGFVFEIYPLGNYSPTTGTRIGFSVDEVDSILTMLGAMGAELISSPADSEWGRRAVVKDLDGHIVELLKPPSRVTIVHLTQRQRG